MLKNVSYIIFKIVIFLDFIIYKFFNKNLKYYVYDYLRNSNFVTIKFKDSSNINLFCPSSMSKMRAEKFYSKEPITIEWIDNFNSSKEKQIIFWDIGANVGTFSIYSALTHKNIEVHAFEPSTSNLVLLSKNISLNNLSDHISINQLPLTDRSSENKHLLMREKRFVEGGAQNSFGVNMDYNGDLFKSKTEYKILGTSIDYMIEKKILDLPDYIKIDVDGIEHFILSGAKETLKEKKIKSVLIEINENFLDQFENCKKVLLEAGFEFKKKDFASSKENKSKYQNMFNYIYERKF